MPKMKTYESFAAYLADQAPARNRTIIRALRRLVARVSPHLVESVKWGNGVWLDGSDPVSYVYSAPDHVQFGFFGGASLEDPERLLEGKGRFVRHVKLRATAGIDARALGALLRQAAPAAKEAPAARKGPARKKAPARGARKR